LDRKEIEILLKQLERLAVTSKQITEIIKESATRDSDITQIIESAKLVEKLIKEKQTKLMKLITEN